MRRVFGSATRLILVALALVALEVVVIAGRAAVALGRTRAPAATVSSAAGQSGDDRQPIDSAQVARLLDAARGANAILCELAASPVDGRSGWSSGSDGDFRAGGSSDAAAGAIVGAVPHARVTAAAVPVLSRALADPDWCVRRLAAPLLGRAPVAAAQPVLLSALGSADAVTREMAALALGFTEDPRSVQPLIARLRDDAPRVRATAAWALGEIERHEAVRPLIDALGDADALVRESAAHALGEVEDAAAIPALTDLLKADRVAAVRRAAAHALGEIAG